MPRMRAQVAAKPNEPEEQLELDESKETMEKRTTEKDQNGNMQSSTTASGRRCLLSPMAFTISVTSMRALIRFCISYPISATPGATFNSSMAATSPNAVLVGAVQMTSVNNLEANYNTCSRLVKVAALDWPNYWWMGQV